MAEPSPGKIIVDRARLVRILVPGSPDLETPVRRITSNRVWVGPPGHRPMAFSLDVGGELVFPRGSKLTLRLHAEDADLLRSLAPARKAHVHPTGPSAKKGPLMDRILDLLRAGPPMTCEAIAEKTALKRATVAAALSNLTRWHGEDVRRDKAGVWSAIPRKETDP